MVATAGMAVMAVMGAAAETAQEEVREATAMTTLKISRADSRSDGPAVPSSGPMNP